MILILQFYYNFKLQIVINKKGQKFILAFIMFKEFKLLDANNV